MPSPFHQVVSRQKARIAELYADLKKKGFEFEYPEEAFAEPDKQTEGYLAEFSKHGCPLPAAVAEFYRQIGSVNLIGTFPGWADVEYPDPLNVMPLGYAIDDFRRSWAHSSDEQDALIKAYGGYPFPVAPDYFHKAGVSGGMAYSFLLPCSDPDPQVLYMPWALRFTEYIDFALSQDGFPGRGLG